MVAQTLHSQGDEEALPVNPISFNKKGKARLDAHRVAQ